MITLLAQRIDVRPDVARSGQQAVAITIDGSSGHPVRVMVSLAQASDLSRAIAKAAASHGDR